MTIIRFNQKPKVYKTVGTNRPVRRGSTPDNVIRLAIAMRLMGIRASDVIAIIGTSRSSLLAWMHPRPARQVSPPQDADFMEAGQILARVAIRKRKKQEAA